MPNRTKHAMCAVVLASLAWAGSVPATAAARDADAVLKTAGVSGGLLVCLGAEDASLPLALQKANRPGIAEGGFLVHALHSDPAVVAKLRRQIRDAGGYGPVSADVLNGAALPYVDNLVTVLVVLDQGEVTDQETLRVLRPGGVVCRKKGATWTRQTKPRPDAIDDWTHYLHDASNNAVAHDTVTGPPRRVQWIANPKWARSHDHLSTTSAAVAYGGRIFTIIDEGPTASVAFPPKWRLVARDAFNGLLLWKRKIDPWEGHLRGFRSGPTELPRRLVAAGDRVYVTLGYGKGVSVLDAATGKTVRELPATENALEIIHTQGPVDDGGVILVVAGDRPPDNTAGAGTPDKPKQQWHWWGIYPEKVPPKHLMAFDAASGKLLWKKDDADTHLMLPSTLAAGGDAANHLVYLQSPTHLVAMDLRTGDVAWRADRPVAHNRPSWSTPTVVVYRDVVLSADRLASPANRKAAGPQPKGMKWMVDCNGGQAPKGEMIAFSATTGKRMWSAPVRECYNAPADVLVVNDLVWTGSLVHRNDPGITAGRDVHTGEVKMTRPADAKQFRLVMSHQRCHRNKATVRYLVLGRDGIEYIDVATGKGEANNWVRGACQYGVMPCNGLVYAPPHSCACHIETKWHSFSALAPAAKTPAPVTPDAKRLLKGPAYNKAQDIRPAEKGKGQESASVAVGLPRGDWPTYRHDPGRSGVATTALATKPAVTWQVELKGPLSSPVAAGGKVYVARIDAHTLCALDAATGKVVWSHTAGGRIDSPPTVWAAGLVYFGCADGTITCLGANDGALVWRYQVAPTAQRIVARGRLESPWPIDGSVLLEDGKVYAVAGRSGFLDGGMTLICLDALKGTKVSATTIANAGLRDVLSSDDASLYLRHLRFDKKLQRQTQPVVHLYSPAGFLDGTWWHRTYWQVGTRMQSGWGAWPNIGNQVPAGRLLVQAGPDVYGFGRLNQYHRNGTHLGLGTVRYKLFACTRQTKPAAAAKPAGKGKAAPRKRGPRRAPAPRKPLYRWSRDVPLMVRAMLLASADDPAKPNHVLFLAGPPDLLTYPKVDPKFPYAERKLSVLQAQVDSFAGRKGAMLWTVSADDGKTLSETKLPSPPVWDGMAAAAGRLFLATLDGRVICLTRPAK